MTTRAMTTKEINELIAGIAGISGGLTKWFLQVSISNPGFWLKTFETVIVAILCGAGGLIGKDLWVWIKKAGFGKRIKKLFKPKT